MNAIQRGLITFALVATLSLGLIACGGGDDDDDSDEAASETSTPSGGDENTATAPPADGDDRSTSTGDAGTSGERDPAVSSDGGCAVTVTGDLEQEWQGSDSSDAVATDYWLSDDEKREIVRIFAGMGGSDLSEEELDATVEAAIASDEPVLGLLLMNCASSTGDRAITFLTSGEATPDDIPFGPGAYTIAAGGIFGAPEQPDRIGVMAALDASADTVWSVSQEGTFEITKWDTGSLEGTFAFDAEESFAENEPRAVHVEGSFHFTCSGSDICD